MLTVRVTASFTAEPLAEVLRFWATELAMPLTVEFAPYGQVFQELLDPAGALHRNRDGVNLVLVRPADLGDPPGFAAALRAADRHTSGPILLAVCPDPPGTDPSVGETVDRLVRDTVADAVHLRHLDPAELAARYPVADPHDAYADRIGRVPYTTAYYTALGTALARTVHALRTARPKVLVLDADNTLWDGIVGEDGPAGITVEGDRRVLHELLLAQRDAGRLLCLCSRNDEADVRAAFAALAAFAAPAGRPGVPLSPDRPAVPLTLDHFSAVRANWRPKSENLRSLAAELDLGLDSFVFLDDSPLEVAEVRAAVPEVLALTLPARAADAVSYLRHCWPLDTDRVTDEDRLRGERYRQEHQRRRLRDSGMSLADFHATLELRVDIRPADPADHPRIAQLSQRTNQFNLAPRRLDVTDLAGCGLDWLTVAVADRFGDYGLVGAVGYTAGDDRLRVDALLLSCRALGRGVEHRMLAHLGELARTRGARVVELRHTPTGRNTPARDFLDRLAAAPVPVTGAAPGPAAPAVIPDAAGWSRYTLPAEVAAAVRFVPGSGAVPEADRPAPAGTVAPSAPWVLVDRIATALTGPAEIRSAMAAARAGAGRAIAAAAPGAAVPAAAVPAAGHDPGTTVPADPVQARVMALWADLLAVAPTSPADNFFALGGQSLQLVQFMARAREVFGVELPVELLFTPTFTVAEVSREIRRRQLDGVDAVELTGLLAELDRLTDDEIELLLADGDD